MGRSIEFVNRSGSDCYKWDSEEAQGTLPLWVADMDFKAAKPIRDAMQRRLEHGVFGYSIVPQANYDAVASWFSRRHGWKGINRNNLLYTTAVVPAISAIFKALQDRKITKNKSQTTNNKCTPLRILTFTPAYNCFFACIENMGCTLVPSPLVVRDNKYEINWEDVAAKAKEADVFLLCNPHNPTGRVWSRDELERLADIMRRENLFVLSDEIHCEFAFPGHAYTPFATLAHDDANYCVCMSASKVAAYNESEAWLDELNEYTYSNFCFLRDYLKQHLPMLILHETEGTYLAWVNISALGISSQCFCERLAKEAHVLLNPSEMYGGEKYVRINLATSHEVLAEALQKMTDFIRTLI